MAIFLGKNAYGKNAVNLSKIIRHPGYHEFRQISVNISLQGDFETAHTLGDNSKIVATDTQKNTVYALAKEHFTGTIEAFALILSGYFVKSHSQVKEVTVDITEHGYEQMSFEGETHPHAYKSKGNEKHTTTVVQDGESIVIRSGIKDLLILKTTDSGFVGFDRDQFTSLKETTDRIFATECEASWVWNSDNAEFEAQYNRIRNTLLHTFAFHKSLSVQQTMYAMGEAVLAQNSNVNEICFAMPNKHHIPFNLQQFGMSNDNEIFVATDEPYGYITGTIVRD